MNKYIILFLFLLLIGCKAVPPNKTTEHLQKEKTYLKPTLPISLGLSYFGGIALHEAGHATAGLLIGSNKIKLSILPGRDDEGNTHLGYTTAYFRRSPSKAEDVLFDALGPTFAFAGQILAREVLKTGYVPIILQPSLQIFSFVTKMQFYSEVGLGLLRKKTADFGKHPTYLPIAFGLAGLSYDIWDIVYCDDFFKYMRVLVGEDFYIKSKLDMFSLNTDGSSINLVYRF